MNRRTTSQRDVRPGRDSMEYTRNGATPFDQADRRIIKDQPVKSGIHTGEPSLRTDEVLYLVDHLATLTVPDNYELGSQHYGITRLRQMEQSNGIWTQRMYLKVNAKRLVVIDYDSGDTVENFPIDWVKGSSHFISQDPKDLYNNVLLVSVNREPHKRSAHELHMFHCVETSCSEVSGQIQRFLSSAKSSSRSGFPLDSPSKTPRETPVDRKQGVNVKERIDHFREILRDQKQYPTFPPHNADLDDLTNDSESHSQHSVDVATQEHNVELLNRCFDDIERFIMRLQAWKASLEQLERRSRGSKKSSGSNRSVPRGPSRDAFVDIFQKFKYCFNLLGVLRSYIHDPNAPELVHFLFTPLIFVFDSCNDLYPGEHLSAAVVEPLLTREAKLLLTNCLSSRETELWHSLGESWTKTRAEWTGRLVADYRPVFGDGLLPEGGFMIGRSERYGSKTSYDSRVSDRHEMAHENKSVSYSSPVTPSVSSRENSYRGRRSEQDHVERSLSHDYFVERGPQMSDASIKLFKVLYTRDGKNQKELSVKKGEILEVFDTSRNWWEAKNSRGFSGYVPHTILAPYNPA